MAFFPFPRPLQRRMEAYFSYYSFFFPPSLPTRGGLGEVLFLPLFSLIRMKRRYTRPASSPYYISLLIIISVFYPYPPGVIVREKNELLSYSFLPFKRWEKLEEKNAPPFPPPPPPTSPPPPPPPPPRNKAFLRFAFFFFISPECRSARSPPFSRHLPWNRK